MNETKNTLMNDFQNALMTVNNLHNEIVTSTLSNNRKREIHESNEICSDIVDQLSELPSNDGLYTENQVIAIKEKIQTIREAIKLSYTNKKNSLLYRIDETIRAISVIICLMTTSTFLSLPSILFKPLDEYLTKKKFIHPKYQFSVLCRRLISKLIMLLAGVKLIVLGDEDEKFQKTSIVCFSHASSLDAFIVSAAVPTKSHILAKAELFLIPFFAWLLVALDGVPVARKNREKSVKAIQTAAESAHEGETVSIAPEGTRSKSGQLLPFKKGAFYMWESLNCPIIPLVTTGAFELLPPGRFMPIPGRVYATFLDVIKPNEAARREDMSNVVRRKMLRGISCCPTNSGSNLKPFERLQNILALFVFHLINWYLWRIVITSIKNRFHLTNTMLVIYGIIATAVITLSLYFYVTQVKFMMMSTKKNQ